MYYLNFKINANVLTSDGRNIASGAVCSFKAYPESISQDANPKLPCDLRFWASEADQTANWDNITVCTDAAKRTTTKLVNAYLAVTVPVQNLTYVIIQGWAKTFLESIYGAGNITILN